VTWGSIGTVLGWVLWDWWVRQEENAVALLEAQHDPTDDLSAASSAASSVAAKEDGRSQSHGFSQLNGSLPKHAHSASASSIQSQHSASSPSGHPNGAPTFANYAPYGSQSSLSPRNQQRLATMKSAILIYCALLGLSPILKSLTKSTSSDSIWAMSCWLMIINVFFFDYGGGVGVKFPASLSTNAALMASTVLASRLPSTEHVFSLTLFSIEVFGLFPVFRRHLRHISWQGHLALTAVLVMGAGGGVGVVVSGGGWKAALMGVILGTVLACLAMGGCSWWLIGLQKYKNEIHGPWDPARPIIRRQWDDD
jgi:phosphatidylinositol glycan class C protein